MCTGCPRRYARDTVNTVVDHTMQDLHHSTVEKNSYLKSTGLNVVEVWECDIKKELERNTEMMDYFASYDMVEPLEPYCSFSGGRTLWMVKK